LTEELCDVLTEFARQGVAALPYKGPVLGQTLYGDIALRQFNDLDILIKPDEVPQAALLLERRGYRNKYQLQPWQAQHLIKNDCEYNFFHAGQQVHLDLHWNFTPRYFTLRFDLDGIRQRARPVTLNGLAVNSLTPEDMLLVLAVNAAKDYWTKLLPLCDIAETVRQTPQLDWPQLWQRATATGAQRMLAISLALAQELWATPLPPWVQEKLSQDTAVARLTPHIKSVLFGPGLPPHSLASYLLPAQTLPNYAARLKFYLIFGWQPSFEDWGLMELPARLGFLYYLTRPIRLTVKYFWRGFSL
jgi:hypothetical protein